MTHKKHHSHELWAFFAGTALGASMGNRQQPRVSDVANRQIYQPRPEVTLPASRVDHAEAVLGYLLHYEEKLLEDRRSINEERTSLLAKRNEKVHRYSIVPMWTRPVYPEIDEIIGLLNKNSIWTVNGLANFSADLAREIFASAIRGFRLIDPDSIPHHAEEIEARITQLKQEILLAIAVYNEWVKNENSKVSIIAMFKRDSFKKIFKNRNIRVPARREIERRLRNLGIETMDDLWSAERALESEVFFEIRQDADYYAIKRELDRIKDLNSDAKLKLYKAHHVKPPN